MTYATVRRSSRSEIEGGRFYVIPDCNRSQKVRMIWCALTILFLLIRIRPDVVISTGAAPGYFALRFARWIGSETIWVDSIANAEELSMAGRIVGPYARLWLTQWQHVAADGGPLYRGSVL